MFEKFQKSRIQHCEGSELRLHFEWKKLIKNAENGQFDDFFEKLKITAKQCFQTGNL